MQNRLCRCFCGFGWESGFHQTQMLRTYTGLAPLRTNGAVLCPSVCSLSVQGLVQMLRCLIDVRESPNFISPNYCVHTPQSPSAGMLGITCTQLWIARLPPGVLLFPLPERSFVHPSIKHWLSLCGSMGRDRAQRQTLETSW